MSFFEAEFPKAIEFQQEGGLAFNTDVLPVQSGIEQRNRIWSFPARGEYTASVIAAQQPGSSSAAFIDAVRTFWLMVGGRADGFRYLDPIDNAAGALAGVASENMGSTSNPAIWQLQKTYSLGGRTLVRTITKPIMAGVVDYENNALANTVVVSNLGSIGVTIVTIDYTTGLITFSGTPTGTPKADFSYHIPVRFKDDPFLPRVERSGPNNRIVRWNIGLVVVAPPNY